MQAPPIDAETGVWKHVSDHVRAAAQEQRLVYQLKNYWDSKRDGEAFPKLSDIRGEEIPDIWPSCFILDTKFSYPYFEYLGRNLAKYSCVYAYLGGEGSTMRTEFDKAELDRTVLDIAVVGYADVVKNREPRIAEDEIRLYDNQKILFRAILLPLSEDGETINFVLGAANGKRIKA